MRAITLILAFALVCLSTSSLAGSWRYQDVEDRMNEPFYQSMLDFGLKELGQQAFQNNQLGYAQVGILKVNSIATQVVNGLRIRFNIDFFDVEEGVHNADIVVYRNAGTDAQEFLFYSLYY